MKAKKSTQKISPLLQQKTESAKHNPQMNWNPAKKPKEVSTDRGKFGMK